MVRPRTMRHQRQQPALRKEPQPSRQIDEAELQVLRVAHDARARRRVLQALDELVERALERPEGHEHRGEHRGAGRVRVDVAVDVEAPRGGRVDHAERRLHLAPVELPRGLVVRQLHRDAGALADRDRLGHRLDQLRPLVAHVRRVEAVSRRDGLGEAHELLRLRRRRRAGTPGPWTGRRRPHPCPAR